MTTTNQSKSSPSRVPQYARLPLGIAVGVLIIVPLVFYAEVGRSLAFSHSPDDWERFATYLGGVAGPPLALIASWLVVVTVRESLNTMTKQTDILRKQMSIQGKQLSMQKGETTLNLLLDMHRNVLSQVDIVAYVQEIEKEALPSLVSAMKAP